MDDPQQIRKVGLAQRLVLWAVLASILASIIPYAFFVAVPFDLYCVYRMAKALTMSTTASVLYLIAMFIPFVQLVCLLLLNRKATLSLRAAGIQAGFMGAKPSDLPPAESS